MFQVTLLAAETRLKISLFLNRLEVEPDELVRNIIDCEAQTLTLPLLKYLHNVLPCPDEASGDLEIGLFLISLSYHSASLSLMQQAHPKSQEWPFFLSAQNILKLRSVLEIDA